MSHLLPNQIDRLGALSITILPQFSGGTMPILPAAAPQPQYVAYLAPQPGLAASPPVRARAPDHDVLEQTIMGINIGEFEEPTVRDINQARYTRAAR